MSYQYSDFDKYQVEAQETAIYPNLGNNLWYPTLGLAGEAGEVAEKIKKVYRDQDGKLYSKTVSELCGELGDVLWYVASLASELEVSMGDIAENNIKKLQSRASRDKVHGEGNSR